MNLSSDNSFGSARVPRIVSKSPWIETSKPSGATPATSERITNSSPSWYTIERKLTFLRNKAGTNQTVDFGVDITKEE